MPSPSPPHQSATLIVTFLPGRSVKLLLLLHRERQLLSVVTEGA